MVHAKNDETVSTFVKVMPKKPWPLFSGHGVIVVAFQLANCATTISSSLSCTDILTIIT